MPSTLVVFGVTTYLIEYVTPVLLESKPDRSHITILYFSQTWGLDGPRTVSYTHLDVYKRQLQSSVLSLLHHKLMA